MTADPLTTRMSVLSRGVPNRILVVDDDELELELMSDRLAAAGYEISTARNGEEALAVLERQWFPLIVTDWEMPVVDGIELVEKLRARGVDDTYVIMLTIRESGLDYERGYFAGVDDYLTKKVPDPELLARVKKGFGALAMRRSLKEARSAIENKGTLDPTGSGAHSHAHLLGTLESEVRRAERYERNLSLMTIGVHVRTHDASAAPVVPDAVLVRVVNTIRMVIRAHVDWIARLDSNQPAFALVFPEAAPIDATAIKSRIQGALRAMAEAAREEEPMLHELFFSFGFAALQRAREERRPVIATNLITVAEHCRQCLMSGGHSQLQAVQGSVTHNVAICCRQGYAVESHCHFMGEVRPETAEQLAQSA